MLSSSGDAQFIGGCSVHRGLFNTSGVLSTSGDTMTTSGGYHEYIGGISLVHQGLFNTWGDFEHIGGYHEHIGGIS